MKMRMAKKSKRAMRSAVESLESRTLMSSTWYVANNGSDGAAGTADAPWSSVQYAVDHAASGDTIMLRNGTYDGGITIHTAGLTLRSALGEMAHIVSPNDDPGVEVAVRIGEDANNTTLAYLDISGGYNYTVKTDSTWYNGSPGEHGPTNVIIRNNRLHDSGADVIKLTPGTNYSKIVANEIYNSGRTGPDNAEGIDAVQANYAICAGNYIHDITTNGIYYKGGSVATLIDSNRITRTGNSGILVGQMTDPEWFDTRVNPDYFESINATVRNNIVWDTEGAGIGSWAALNPRIYNNTLRNVAKTMFAGLLIQGQENWVPDDRIIPSKNVWMFNNIVMVNSDRPVLEIRENGLVGALNLGNNIYWQNGRTPLIRNLVSGYEGDLAGWQAAGLDNGSFVADPKLSSDWNMNLLPGSPAINRGIWSNVRMRDIDGTLRPAYGIMDIGAQEAT